MTGAACDDGQFCNGTEICNLGICGSSTGDPCDGPDGDGDCAETCDEAADSCTASDPNDAPCDDGQYCNGTELCTAGVCGGSTGDPCTGPDGDADCAESCDEAGDTCTGNDPNGSVCTDDLFCNGTETCNAGSCGGSSGDPCVGPDGDDDCVESCDETNDDCLGNDADDAPCDDGIACNGDDTCLSGSCTEHDAICEGGGGSDEGGGAPGGAGGSEGGAGGNPEPAPDAEPAGCGCRFVTSPRRSDPWKSLTFLVICMALARRRLRRHGA